MTGPRPYPGGPLQDPDATEDPEPLEEDQDDDDVDKP